MWTLKITVFHNGFVFLHNYSICSRNDTVCSQYLVCPHNDSGPSQWCYVNSQWLVSPPHDVLKNQNDSVTFIANLCDFTMTFRKRHNDSCTMIITLYDVHSDSAYSEWLIVMLTMAYVPSQWLSVGRGTLQVVTAGREVNYEEVRMKISFRLTLLTCAKSFRESNVSQFILKFK